MFHSKDKEGKKEVMGKNSLLVQLQLIQWVPMSIIHHLSSQFWSVRTDTLDPRVVR